MADIRIAQAAPAPAAPAGRGAAPAGPGRGGPQRTGPVMAGQLIELILARLATPSRPRSNDRLIAGDPLTPVTGIATVAMATFDALKAAVAAKKNLILTADSTWWSENDGLASMEGNETFRAKRDFIRANNLVIYRIADHLADTRPNPIAAGMARELGWEDQAAQGAEAARFRLPPTNLLQLSQFLQTRLGARTLRVIGDPTQPVSNVGAIWGRATQMPAIRALRSDIDVLIVGYTFEWEAVLYAQDQNAIGMKKGLILLGQVPSLQGGMKYFAEWVRGQITEVPVEHIALVETWWNLDRPVNEIKTTI
jgi:putative NIF3 family GTP cyclohydrolase 1 type 2